jgi:HK97 family phage portal protein
MFGGASRALNAMGANGTLYNIVSTYANGTSRVDWHLYQKAKSGKEEDRKEITSHLALDVWNRPNTYYTQQLFIETFQQHVELVGEGWWVVDRNIFGWPETMWIVRPDRIQPIPGRVSADSQQPALLGYLYTAPTGEQVPLPTENVIPLKMPNPADPSPAGRGLGATQTILTQLEAVYLSAEWNRNFFANSAVPGGVIEVVDTLGDRDFNRLQMQWGETHKGVSNAGRVGILEGGAKWVDSTISQRDMQFVELLNTSREVIREAFGFPKAMTGDVADVNRSNMDASLAMFGGERLVPRLDRIKDVLNTWYLPMFGPSGHGTGTPDVEFDYDNPVPPNTDQENATTTAKVNAYVALTRDGVDPADVSSYLDMPLMNHIAPPQPALPVVPATPATPNNPGTNAQPGVSNTATASAKEVQNA